CAVTHEKCSDDYDCCGSLCCVGICAKTIAPCK
nr:Chain A, G117 [Conus geographus]